MQQQMKAMRQDMRLIHASVNEVRAHQRRTTRGVEQQRAAMRAEAERMAADATTEEEKVDENNSPSKRRRGAGAGAGAGGGQ